MIEKIITMNKELDEILSKHPIVSLKTFLTERAVTNELFRYEFLLHFANDGNEEEYMRSLI